ncbi:hypothetical protein GCM10009621_05440 [Corynebacterium felinum]
MVAILSAVAVACGGVHVAPSFAQDPATDVTTGVIPPAQNPNDLYVHSIEHSKFENRKLEVNGHAGWLTLKWSNTHPGMQETAPVVGRKFEIELPEPLIFFKRRNQSPPKDFPMELADGSAVGMCRFHHEGSNPPVRPRQNRKITCALDQRAVDAWHKNGKRDFKGDFKVLASNAGAVTAESLDFTVNGQTVPLPLPDGRIDAMLGINYNRPYQKSNNSPRGKESKVNWYFLVGGARIKDKLKNDPGALAKLASSEKFTLTIEDALQDPALYFADEDLTGESFTLRKRINHRTNPVCSADEYADDRAGSTCHSETVDVPFDVRVERVEDSDNKIKIHITADFDEEGEYIFGGLNTRVRNNVVQDYVYTNSSELKYGNQISIGTGTSRAVWRIYNQATAQYSNPDFSWVWGEKVSKK